MFEEVLKKKKHFIIIGGNDAKIVIGTDNLEEVSRQEWFRLVTDSGTSIDEDELARVAEEEERRLREQEARMQREQEMRRQESVRHAQQQAQQQMRREEEQRRAEEYQQPQQAQQPPQPPQFARQERAPPQNLEFPFLDVTPDKMSPDIWGMMNQEQQAEWQQKYGIN